MHLKELEDLGAAVYAVAPDETESLRKLALGSGLGYPVLRDPGGETIIRYGIRNERHTDGVLPDPTALVIDREGKVRYERIDVDYTKRPPAEELVAAVRKLKG
jgi:peroxiredoxin